MFLNLFILTKIIKKINEIKDNLLILILSWNYYTKTNKTTSSLNKNNLVKSFLIIHQNSFNFVNQWDTIIWKGRVTKL